MKKNWGKNSHEAPRPPRQLRRGPPLSSQHGPASSGSPGAERGRGGRRRRARGGAGIPARAAAAAALERSPDRRRPLRERMVVHLLPSRDASKLLPHGRAPARFQGDAARRGDAADGGAPSLAHGGERVDVGRRDDGEPSRSPSPSSLLQLLRLLGRRVEFRAARRHRRVYERRREAEIAEGDGGGFLLPFAAADGGRG